MQDVVHPVVCNNNAYIIMYAGIVLFFLAIQSPFDLKFDFKDDKTCLNFTSLVKALWINVICLFG